MTVHFFLPGSDILVRGVVLSERGNFLEVRTDRGVVFIRTCDVEE